MDRRLWSVLVLLAACDAAQVKLGEGDSGVDADSGGDSGDSGADSGDSGDSAADSGGDSGDSGADSGGDSGDSGGDSGDSGAPVTVSDLSAALHPQMTSIVVLTWTQDGEADVHAEYGADATLSLSTPEYRLGAGEHHLLLLGAPYAEDVSWRLVVNDAPAAADATIRTGSVPSGVPLVDRVSEDSSRWDLDTGWVMASLAPQGGSSSTRAWTVIIDRQGRLVWANESPTSRTTFMPMVSVDGTEILIDYNSWWGAFDGGANSEVVRLDIEGDEIGSWATPGLIHPFTQTGDGSIVWGASRGSSNGSGENLDILTPDGTRHTLLDCNSFVRGHGESYCGSNALFWDPDTNHVLFSLYSAETLLEVDLDGNVVRWFGHMDDGWGFASSDSAFWWQHGAHFLPDGHLIVSSRVDSRTNETVVREYELDETHEQLVEVWSFGEGEGVWAYIMGEPRRLLGGNTLHNYGYEPRIREATPDGDVVWDVQWDDNETIGRMTALDDLYPFWHDTP